MDILEQHFFGTSRSLLELRKFRKSTLDEAALSESNQSAKSTPAHAEPGRSRYESEKRLTNPQC